MVKHKRRGRVSQQKIDDIELPEPSTQDNSFFYDEVDAHHTRRDKILLKETEVDSSDVEENEELFPVVSDEDLDCSSDDAADPDNIDAGVYERHLKEFQREHFQSALASDIEDEQSEGSPADEDDEMIGKDWGNRKTSYYGGIALGHKKGWKRTDIDSDEVSIDELEEKEALALQKRLVASLDEEDFGWELFKPTEASSSQTTDETHQTTSSLLEEKVQRDLSKLSRSEKLKIVQRESPELPGILQELTSLAGETERQKPLLSRCRSIPHKEQNALARFLTTKQDVSNFYQMNILFYLMMKAKQTPVQDHPVIKRLVQFRNLLNQLEPLTNIYESEISHLLLILSRGESIDTRLKKTAKSCTRDAEAPGHIHSKRKKHKSAAAKAENDAADNALCTDMIAGTGALEQARIDTDGGSNSPTEDRVEKRAITYQISKNKGLTAKKEKEARNPRVKLRRKFRKARVRRKGQVRETRHEMNPYSGELSGLRSGVKRGVKLH